MEHIYSHVKHLMHRFIVDFNLTRTGNSFTYAKPHDQKRQILRELSKFKGEIIHVFMSEGISEHKANEMTMHALDELSHELLGFLRRHRKDSWRNIHLLEFMAIHFSKHLAREVHKEEKMIHTTENELKSLTHTSTVRRLLARDEKVLRKNSA